MSITLLSSMVCASVTPATFDQRGYYLMTQDFRKCIHPLCGGWWVQRVNKRKMKCADGTKSATCYVAEIEGDYPPEFPVVNQERFVKGDFSSKDYENFGALGHFVLDSHYNSATTASGTGRFVGVKDNGIRCITFPCFSLTEYILNKKKTKDISSVDYGDLTTENPAMVAWAQNQIAAGEVVIMSGTHRRTTGPAGKGKELVVNQIYQSTKCPAGYSWHKDACRTAFGCIFPELEHLIVGGAPFFDPVTGEITSSMTTVCVTTCPPTSIPDGPGKCVTFAP